MNRPAWTQATNPSMLKRLSSLAFPYGLLVLLVVVFYWRAVFLGELFLTNDIAGSDMMMQSYPARAELAETLREGRLSLWTDRLFLGFPVAAEGQVGVFYPLNLLFFSILPADRAYAGLMVLHVILAGLFTVLCARALGRSRTSAVLAGAVLALSAFMVTHLKHVNLIASVAWVPLVLWFVARWSRQMDRWRPAVWIGSLVALAVLAGHVQTAYNALLVAGLCLAGLVLGRAVGERTWIPVRQGLVAGVVLVVVAAGLSAVQTSLTSEYAALGTRSGGLPYEEATAYDFRLEDLVMYLAPYHFGDPGRATYYATGEVKSLFWENCGYVGILPLALALLGAVACWRARGVKLLVGLAVLSILLVQGRGSPVHALFYHVVPGFDRFRFPSRFLLFVTFSLAVLSAYGLDWLGDRLKGVGRARGAAKAAALLLSVAGLFAFGYAHNPTLPASEWLEEPESVRFLERDPSRFRVWSPDAHVLHLEAYRRANGWKSDLTPYVEHRNALQPNFNGLYGVHSLGVYFPVVPTLFLDERTGLDLEPPGLWRLLDLYNVKYVLMGGEIRDPHFVLREEFRGGVKVYENLGVLPRARVVPRGIPVTSPDHALSVVTRPRFDPREMVTLEGWDGRGGGGSLEGSRVREVARRGGRVELDVSMTGAGFLVLADAFYPGWEAWVDGRKEDILRANVVSRAVALRPGEHRVVFRYLPRSLRRGLVVTLVFLAGIGALLGRDWARRGGARPGP